MQVFYNKNSPNSPPNTAKIPKITPPTYHFLKSDRFYKQNSPNFPSKTPNIQHPPITSPRYSKALAYHARDDATSVLADTLEMRRKGWARIALCPAVVRRWENHGGNSGLVVIDGDLWWVSNGHIIMVNSGLW